MEENNDLRELLKHTEDELVNILNKETEDIGTDSRVQSRIIIFAAVNRNIKRSVYCRYG